MSFSVYLQPIYDGSIRFSWMVAYLVLVLGQSAQSLSRLKIGRASCRERVF